MTKLIWIVGMILLSAGEAAAQQQGPCRSMYQLGETVPAACRDAHKSGVPAYQRWGEGYGSTGPTRPTLPDPGWRYQGGYSLNYGFGR